MTERFSPEYIAFILSDEAMIVQNKLDDISVGDNVTDGDGVYVVVGMDTNLPEPTTLICYWPDTYSSLSICADDVLRIPSLTDLLGMIEEAGYDILANSWTEDGERRYEYIGCERATVETDWNSAWAWPGFASSWELTAAKLAVRALQEVTK